MMNQMNMICDWRPPDHMPAPHRPLHMRRRRACVVAPTKIIAGMAMSLVRPACACRGESGTS